MTVKVSPKYQIVIPEKVRQALNLKPGNHIDVIVKGKIAYLVPIRSLDEVRKSIAATWTDADKKSIREKKDR